MMTYEELGLALDALADAESLNGIPMFPCHPHERPMRWFDNAHWRCTNGHVTENTVHGFVGEMYCYDLCSQCGVKVRLTFPEDVTGPLAKPKAFM
jgi:hypothetical protein